MSGANYGAAVNDLGSAVGDLFTAAGARQAASMYKSAAAEATANATTESGNIITQEAQGARTTALIAGTQMAETSAAGFAGAAGSSTAQAISFANQQQFSLNLHNQVAQDVIQENAYKSQAEADQSMAAQEETKAEGADVGAVFSVAASVASAI